MVNNLQEEQSREREIRDALNTAMFESAQEAVRKHLDYPAALDDVRAVLSMEPTLRGAIIDSRKLSLSLKSYLLGNEEDLVEVTWPDLLDCLRSEGAQIPTIPEETIHRFLSEAKEDFNNGQLTSAQEKVERLYDEFVFIRAALQPFLDTLKPKNIITRLMRRMEAYNRRGIDPFIRERSAPTPMGVDYDRLFQSPDLKKIFTMMQMRTVVLEQHHSIELHKLIETDKRDQ